VLNTSSDSQNPGGCNPVCLAAERVYVLTH